MCLCYPMLINFATGIQVKLLKVTCHNSSALYVCLHPHYPFERKRPNNIYTLFSIVLISTLLILINRTLTTHLTEQWQFAALTVFDVLLICVTYFTHNYAENKTGKKFPRLPKTSLYPPETRHKRQLKPKIPWMRCLISIAARLVIQTFIA